MNIDSCCTAVLFFVSDCGDPSAIALVLGVDVAGPPCGRSAAELLVAGARLRGVLPVQIDGVAKSHVDAEMQMVCLVGARAIIIASRARTARAAVQSTQVLEHAQH